MSPKPECETEYIEPPNGIPPCKICVCACCPEATVIGEVHPECLLTVEKPKKNFWQQIFGDGWIGRKKQKNKIIDYTSECVDKNCKLCNSKKNTTKPVCCCKKQQCQKGCCPTSRSICGCQFYFSLENRPKKYCSSRRRSPASERQKPAQSSPDGEMRKPSTLSVTRTTSISSASFTDDECNRESLKYDHKSRNRSLSQSYGQEERGRSPDYTNRRRSRSSHSKNRETRSPSKNDKPEKEDQVDNNHKPKDNDSNIRIGVTFMKEEIKYLKPHDAATSTMNGEECDILDKNLRDDSGRKVRLKVCTDQSAKHAPLRPTSVVLDDHYNLGTPKCESFSREISPLLLKRSNRDKPKEHENDTLSIKIKRPVQTYERCSVKEENLFNRKRTSLDKRVSEILEKLYDIEEKINVIEKKSTEQKDIRVGCGDGRKSSVTVHVKKEPRRSIEENKNTNQSNSCSKDDTVIEIRQAQSKACSPFEIQSSPEFLNKRKVQSNRKIIITIPNTDRFTNRCITAPNDNNDSMVSSNMEEDYSDWCDVSNDLKMSVPKLRCYCYNCIIKRNLCCKY